ncbi:hypothetical protein KVK67_00940 [Helicobacter pylori]|nr:hypothetical protein KVK67_00940 [Helicobacter pylori]
MAYFESITAGRGGLDSFNQALNNQRYANLVLNESMGNFANTIANAGSLFDNAKIREEALKYQRMRDLANDKKQAEAFDLQKRQAEQGMELAKQRHAMDKQEHKRNEEIHKHRVQAQALENMQNQEQWRWLKEANKKNAKASGLVGNEAKNNANNNAKNNAMKTTNTPTTPTTLNPLNALNTPIIKPKPTTKEELKNFINSNPFFRY